MDSRTQVVGDHLARYGHAHLTASTGVGGDVAAALALAQLPRSGVILIVAERVRFAAWGDLLARYAGMSSDRYFLTTPQALLTDQNRLGYINTLLLDECHGGPKKTAAMASVAGRAGRVWTLNPTNDLRLALGAGYQDILMA